MNSRNAALEVAAPDAPLDSLVRELWKQEQTDFEGGRTYRVHLATAEKLLRRAYRAGVRCDPTAAEAAGLDALVDRENFEVSALRDGSVVLSCGRDGMEVDLVFAQGAMTGDPLLEKQTAILEFIVRAVNAYNRAHK